MNITEFITLGKDFDVKMGHHSSVPPEEFDIDKHFKPAIRRTDLEGYGEVPHADYDIFNDSDLPDFVKELLASKPKEGTGLWASPIIERYDRISTEWFDADLVETRPEFYEIIPDDDCRIFVLDNDEAMLCIDNYYRYNYEKMREDFDVLYIPVYKYMRRLCRYGNDSDYLAGKCISRNLFYGWDIESALYMNKKFKVGHRHNIEIVNA